VAGRAGATVPLVAAKRGSPAVGLLGTTSPVPAGLSRVVTSPRLNLRPDGGGRLLLQALNLEPSVLPEAPPSTVSEPGAELLRRAGGILRRLEDARLESLRVGVRPLPRDGLTVAGWAPDVEGLYVLVTHSGITLAPVLGELVAQEIGYGGEEPLLAPFRPARFSS
jgi:glycine/D-amino acid oxidase-like deaminating enzyme